MINLYKCEKCGKVFNAYEDCAKCEDSHVAIDWWDTQSDIDNQTAEYKEGEALPTTVKISGSVQYGDYDEDAQKYKKYRTIGTYKLIKMYTVQVPD